MKNFISIIIVYYKAQEVLFNSLNSIKKNKPKFNFEVIIVDNDDETKIDKKLKKNYPWVSYIKSTKNLGFGGGNNLGAKYAKGQYLFFLNPDTLIFPNTVDALVKFLNANRQAAIVAPVLLDPHKKPYKLQGALVLTPLRGILSLSFINKLFPDNPISKKYWLEGWDRTKVIEVGVVPGTAFMIRKKIFDAIKGFDENFFLYFEENDLCKRVKERGYKIFITPDARLIHLWGKGGTNKAKNISSIFKKSRFYYFRKHYGIINALLVEIVVNFNKKIFTYLIIIIFIIIFSIELYYKL